jgi:hypothetical protein
MTKIVFFFQGTGDDVFDKSLTRGGEEEFKDCVESDQKGVFEGDDVIRIYFRGCQDANIGGRSPLTIFPDLEIVANKINNAFDDGAKTINKAKTINLKTLKEQFGDSIYYSSNFLEENSASIEIDQIGLQGFSRGAVTCFAVAKKLDHLGIPMDIIADRPVPGQMFETSPLLSLYSQYSDLSGCENIKTATTLLASHDLKNGVLQNTFFQQMVAKFHSKTECNNWLLPSQSHVDNYLISFNHTLKRLCELGYVRKDYVKESSAIYAEEIKKHYNDEKQKQLCFTPKEFSQKIFGASKDMNITRDPMWLDAIKERATGILSEKKIEHDALLNNEEAIAIVAIESAGSLVLSGHMKKKLISNCLIKNEQSKAFIQFVNKMHEITQYLKYRGDAKYNNCIDDYKEKIFVDYFNYLSNPSKEGAKAELVKKIEDAQIKFGQPAFVPNRSMSDALTVITNFIRHIVNNINCLFSPSFKAMREISNLATKSQDAEAPTVVSPTTMKFKEQLNFLKEESESKNFMIGLGYVP